MPAKHGPAALYAWAALVAAWPIVATVLTWRWTRRRHLSALPSTAVFLLAMIGLPFLGILGFNWLALKYYQVSGDSGLVVVFFPPLLIGLTVACLIAFFVARKIADFNRNAEERSRQAPD